MYWASAIAAIIIELQLCIGRCDEILHAWSTATVDC